MKTKRKIFPKLQKSISKFLTDESGKITKKDALWISLATGMLLASSDALAGTSTHNQHVSSISPNNPTYDNQTFYYNNWATCSHMSWLLNGHLSGTPSPTLWGSTTHGSHANHGSHSNHGSWGWC